MNNLVDIKEWEQKRKTTFFVYMLLYFFAEFEKSINTATLWFYLTKLMKTNQPVLYYGLISAAVYILPFLLSSVVARFADKTRRIKLIIIIINFVSMLGSILYVISVSPLFPFTGKLLNGCVIILQPLIIGETARSYPSEEIQSKFAYLIVSATLGFMIGPCVVLPFAEIDFCFGQLRVGYGNISGILLLVTIICIQCCVVCFAHDLSREYDMKEAASTDKSSSIIGDVSKSNGIKVVKKAFKSKVLMFMFALTFSSVIGSISSGRNFPFLVLNVLLMSYKWISAGLIFQGIGLLLPCLVVIKTKTGSVVVFWIGVLGQVSLVILLTCQYIFVSVHLFFSIKVAMLLLYLLTTIFVDFSEQLFLVVAFSKLVSSQHQSYSESKN
ncbi:uncharacterized protein LOC130649130 [Hydractinia symbiolongicarpus]|uniref:uncharacterized protein LOC130649130 n=1 Tax=Hydractinia symbiolongicarpus TaxID=13093 RepID=UPI00254AAAC8|nr:uncharacterized protein LOC130649130 [Hydractinia symbiolongicarpus]